MMNPRPSTLLPPETSGSFESSRYFEFCVLRSYLSSPNLSRKSPASSHLYSLRRFPVCDTSCREAFIFSLTILNCRIFKDYAVLYCGSSIFKITRLLFIAIISVHFFACAFYRVKKESALSPDDVDAFYQSKNVDSTVILWKLFWKCRYYVELNVSVLKSLQDLSKIYVGLIFHSTYHKLLPVTFMVLGQLCNFYYVLTTFTTVGYGCYQIIECLHVVLQH